MSIGTFRKALVYSLRVAVDL